MEGVLTRNGQSCLVAYRGNGASDMTSGVELFFISFVICFCLLSSLASGSLRCPFGVMRDGPHVGKIRSRDPPWILWPHFLLSYLWNVTEADILILNLWIRASVKTWRTCKPMINLALCEPSWVLWYCSKKPILNKYFNSFLQFIFAQTTHI